MNLDDGTFFGVRAPLVDLFDLRAHALSEDAATAILPWSDRFLNAAGTISGPAIVALLDFTLAAAVRAHDPLRWRVATLDLSTKFLKPGRSTLIAECRCEHRGSRTCFASGVVYDSEGDKIAIANGVFMLTQA
ncbi:PaaI family thioesterase [Achromobacter spanius]|uniref:PaaI family thioesterase n=1 Tax=Achromobacter spanius TaxID=217203 RepID=UPI00320A269E